MKKVHHKKLLQEKGVGELLNSKLHEVPVIIRDFDDSTALGLLLLRTFKDLT